MLGGFNYMLSHLPSLKYDEDQSFSENLALVIVPSSRGVQYLPFSSAIEMEQREEVNFRTVKLRVIQGSGSDIQVGVELRMSEIESIGINQGS
jgi:hypothetical protein